MNYFFLPCPAVATNTDHTVHLLILIIMLLVSHHCSINTPVASTDLTNYHTALQKLWEEALDTTSDTI